jgi:AAA+ ATPase superfamily predicted ATPase
MAFWDRDEALNQIRHHLGRGQFGYVTGRRRVGKTALLLQAAKRFGGLYHQAVEGAPQQQLLHVAEEFREALPIFREITPRTWSEFLRLLSRERLPRLVIIDEFPYWVKGDASWPSVLQKWIDHDLPKSRTLLLVSGSSQAMLHSQLLHQGAPLYGRATLHLHLPPLSYRWFCRALRYEASDPAVFARFTLVGGVPHYWNLMRRQPFVREADLLYFRPSAILAEEPIHLTRDEGIGGAMPKAILDLIGRGVSKPSELASRLGTVQSNLSRPLALLLDLGLVQRELPFGESPRTTKKVLYVIQDPALSFYYGTYLRLRSRWEHLSPTERAAALLPHVSRQWEHFCRQAHPGSGRYWERTVELDLVAYHPASRRHMVAECKWTRLTARAKRDHLARLRERFQATALSRTLRRVDFQILTQEDLRRLSAKSA